MIICGLIGSLCYVPRNIYVNIIGIVLFQLSYFWDTVDGEIARLRKQSSLFGIYLDQVSHIVIEPLFCATIGIHLYLLQPCTANLLVALMLYSGWHWLREITRVRVTTLLAKAKIPIEQIKYPSASKQSRTLVKMMKHCAGCFVDDIHAKTIAGVALLLSYWQADILKYFCWVHAVLIILFCLRQMRIDIRELPQYQKQ
jgi:phosphatidylserine synthase